MSRRISSGHAARNIGSPDGDILSRSNSIAGLTDDAIKGATQRFDLEIVFKLHWTYKGLTRISGLEKCINLVELNLSGNQITKIEGLESVLQLRRLVLSSNRIARVEGVSHLSRLESLHLQDNQLASLDALALPQLAALPGLRCLYLRNLDRSAPNPVCRTPGYKAALLAALPRLGNLDGERSPASLNYAELAAEYDAFRAAPPPPREVVLPNVAPWLAGVSMELPAGGGPAEGELQQRHAKVGKALDECDTLVRSLAEEISRFGQQLEAKAAAGEQAKA